MSDLESKGTARRLSGRSASLAGLSALIVAAACSTGSGSGTLGTSGAVGSTSSPAPSAASGYVTLTRGAHPLARPEYDVGRLDPTRVLHNLSLVFKLSPGQRADRDALLAEIERPGSPVYRQWLTPEEYAVRFGAQSDDIARASSWLASQGMTVHEPSRLGARVTFTGTVAQIEAAFQTEMHLYSVHGETHYAMARPPSVPADLGDRVLAVYNAHDFYPRHSKPQIKVVEPDAPCPAGDSELHRRHGRDRAARLGDHLRRQPPLQPGYRWDAHHGDGRHDRDRRRRRDLADGSHGVPNALRLRRQPDHDDAGAQHGRRTGRQRSGHRGRPRHGVVGRHRSERDDPLRLYGRGRPQRERRRVLRDRAELRRRPQRELGRVRRGDDHGRRRRPRGLRLGREPRRHHVPCVFGRQRCGGLPGRRGDSG